MILDSKILAVDKKGRIVNQYIIPNKSLPLDNLKGKIESNWWNTFFELGIIQNLTFDRKNHELPKFFKKEDLPKNYVLEVGESIHHIMDYKRNFFIIRKKDHLLLFNQQKELISDFSKDFLTHLPNTHISFPPLIRNNQIWFGNNQGFTIFDYKRNPFDQYLNFGSFSTRGILSLPNNEILVVGYRETSKINEETQIIKSIKNLPKMAKRGVAQFDSTNLSIWYLWSRTSFL